ncbi:hypothetical protein H310_01150 [Aphanomyces invadans]|uniref:Phytanoyl-CoA dioxygenase n=1 Tax=Aphanomyces invadans TaxID=157072 RepID=A0A024UQ82_9STRA|nr:hypothetical protein H310_01150 [Aphanomyces invadans]ETW08606.1 hypothetical protein H310_01150 [Aphanomyces invadans]|eukprot:XP_008862411.1 hypothetical protein H310_01150 [Aphanomyces invadans]
MEFYPAYAASDKEGYVEAFKRDGFVVIDNVLTGAECEASCGEIWDYLEHNGRVKRDDATTWGNDAWPREVCRNGGFVGRFPYWKRMKKLDPTFLNKQPQSWRNRQNKVIYEVFSTLLEAEQLWVSIDRYGVMRPGKVAHELLQGVDDEANLNWTTKHDWLHWDLSPFHFGTSAAGFLPNDILQPNKVHEHYGGVRVQGLIALCTCPVESGGFHCVPGFTGDRFFNWAKAHEGSYGALPQVATRNFIEVPEDDDMRREITKIPMKAGSLLIWNSQLPHGNFPNDGFNFRMVQYVKMIPTADTEFRPAMQLSKFDRAEWFPSDFTPTPLGNKLFGLDKW